jgi:hypothetical protein
MHRPTFLTVALACFASSHALAQTPAVPRVGQRVRVTSAIDHTPVLKGQVGAISADTLLLRQADGDGNTLNTAIPLGSIAQLDVSRGRRSHWVRGLVIGTVMGAAAGAAIGAASRDENDWLVLTEVTALYGAMVFAPIGGGVGLIVGALARTERWETVPLDRVGPHIARGPGGGLSLGARVTF